MTNGMNVLILRAAIGIAAFGFIAMIASFGLTTHALQNAGAPPLAGVAPGTLFDVHAIGADIIVYEDEQAYRRHLSLENEGDFETLAREQKNLTACEIMGRAKVRLLDLRDDIARIEVTSGDQWGCRGYVRPNDLASFATPIQPAAQ